MCLLDSLKLCKFGLYGKLNLTDLTRFIHDVIGWDMSVAELWKPASAFLRSNVCITFAAASAAKSDTLPPRILSQPRRDEGSGDNVPPLGRMLNEYYQIRGWNDEGIPTPETLERLRLAHLSA
jgi:aldehyde:ferredoxin oxidoreductase